MNTTQEIIKLLDYELENQTPEVWRTLRLAKYELEKLLQCCDFTKDGKPVKRGAILYLMPNDDPYREPMTLQTTAVKEYCWYENVEDAKQAAAKQLQ